MITIKKKPVKIFPVLKQAMFLLIIVSLLNSVFAASGNDIKDRPIDVRLDRLERLMSSQKQLELLYRMKQLQQENQQLRSLLDEQQNEIRILKQHQKELYSDLDRRLSRMEGSADAALTEPSSALVEQRDEPVVLDKSTLARSKYGITEREEIEVAETNDQSVANKSAVNKPVVNKPVVPKAKPMSEKERQQEQKDYQMAYDELRARRYSKARDSFVRFIEQYPGGRYAHIAQYWIAESSYVQQQYKQAITDYQLLLDRYPSSPKKAEAELKKAFSYNELGNKESARQTLNQLLINYPDTTEAGQARRLLKQL